MDDSSRRRLLFPGVGVLLLGLAGLSPFVLKSLTEGSENSAPPPVAVHIVHSVLVVSLGLGLMIGSRRTGPVPNGFVALALIAVTGGTLAGFTGYLVHSLRFDPLFLCTVIAALLHAPAVPLMWGTAMARRTDPTNVDSQKFGRIGAGLVQLAFIFVFIAELRTFDGRSMSNIEGGGTVAALYGLQRVVSLVDRVLLLWASIESVRTCADEESFRRRAERIHKLMLYWLGAMVVSSAIWAAMGPAASHRWLGMDVWRPLALGGMPPAAALMVAARYARGYKSAAPEHP